MLTVGLCQPAPPRWVKRLSTLDLEAELKFQRMDITVLPHLLEATYAIESSVVVALNHQA